MAIEAVTPPVRTRTRESRFSDADIDAAYKILTTDGGKAAKCVSVKVSEQKGKQTKKGRRLTAEDVALNKARSVAHGLNRAVQNKHGREFSTSSWIENGNAVGALLPREPKRRKDAKS